MTAVEGGESEEGTVFTELLRGSGRVLFVTNDFPPQHGGIQTFVRQLCDERPAHRVVVYAPSHPRADDHDAGLPFVVRRDDKSLLLPTPGLVRRLTETIRDHQIEQVVYGASVPLGLLAPVMTDLGVQHQVALTHGHEVWWAALPGSRQALRRVARHVDVMTFVSDYTGARITAGLKGAPCRFVKLAPQPDASFHQGVSGDAVRREYGIPEDAVVVVCVARLVRRKGQDRLVRMWPKLLERFPNAYLLLVGDGPDRERLQRLASRRGLGDRVLFTGAVEATPPYYAAGDVFAMPVRNRFFGLEVEGLGISYLEAAAVGLTVVPGKHGGAPEAVNKQIGPRRMAGTDLSSSP
jgi:phosphatidyl-myo-inositol dimannoside synthase